MTPTQSQIDANERSKRFHASIAAKAAELNRPKTLDAKSAAPFPSQTLTLAHSPVSERLDALERQIADLQEVVAHQGCLISKLSKESLSDTPRISEIIGTICDYYGITLAQLTSQRKNLVTTKPRQIAYYLGRKLTGLSLPQIGNRLGRRDHTSVLHGANKIAKEIQRDEILRDDIDVLELKIAEKVLNREAPRGQQVVHKLPTP